MDVLNQVTQAVLFVFSALAAFRVLYTAIGVVSPAVKYPETNEMRKYAVVYERRRAA